MGASSLYLLRCAISDWGSVCGCIIPHLTVPISAYDSLILICAGHAYFQFYRIELSPFKENTVDGLSILWGNRLKELISIHHFILRNTLVVVLIVLRGLFLFLGLLCLNTLISGKEVVIILSTANKRSTHEHYQQNKVFHFRNRLSVNLWCK